MPFVDRVEAGRLLAQRLEYLQGEDVVVLGLPRGGVPVAAQVAQSLNAPLDVLLVRKLGVPTQPELAMGAIGEDGVRVLESRVLHEVPVTRSQFEEVESAERSELARRARRFRGGRPLTPLQGRVAVVVDDGIATGSTARAACQVAREHGARRVVLAVPVAPPRTVASLGDVADEVVCLETPSRFFAIGEFYADFTQTGDDEVVTLLATHAGVPRPRGAGQAGPDGDVEVSLDGVRLGGRLVLPENAFGVVLFAHGSGSSRFSPRNQYVAGALHDAGVGTLLFDLLTTEEERARANVFDIPLLGGRLVQATAWLRGRPEAVRLPVGYFGASTGAAAALWAAAEPHAHVAAVVSRGGRPDLAAPRLPDVRAPTLLVVGGADPVVLDLNRQAQQAMRCENRLEVVPHATHLFGEPGALEAVAGLARTWFLTHLVGADATRGRGRPGGAG